MQSSFAGNRGRQRVVEAACTSDMWDRAQERRRRWFLVLPQSTVAPPFVPQNLSQNLRRSGLRAPGNSDGHYW